MRRASCPSRSLNLVCKIPILLLGLSETNTIGYKCQNTACPCYSFQRDLFYKGRTPAIKEQIVDMSLNGSGIRDTARVLKVSPTTVINTLKKKSLLSSR
jgi:transposase-like protein